jgi:DNA-binding XRE family transcriptional regulator
VSGSAAEPIELPQGTPEKIKALSRRALTGRPLFQPQDRMSESLNARGLTVGNGDLMIRGCKPTQAVTFDRASAVSLEIIRMRKLSGLSQPELAKKVGVGESTIRRYEHGKVPKYSVLIRIAEACGFRMVAVPA